MAAEHGEVVTRIDGSLEVHHRYIPVGPAHLAIALIERCGLVAAAPDGEDSAGRQKLAPHEPAVLVRLACETASAAFAQFGERGWLVEAPLGEERKKLAAERREELFKKHER